MRKISIFASAVAFVWLLGGQVSAAEKSDDKKHAELAKVLGSDKVSLDKGLAASESQGNPISAKYELEDGKLQLSVYTVQSDKFFETIVDQFFWVVVDYNSGSVAKTEPITVGDDLDNAIAQRDGMDKAKVSLRKATEKAVKDNKGYRAVSVTPSLKEGHPVAEILLIRGEEFKTASEKLD